MTYIEYKYVSTLPENYIHNESNKDRVVVAVRKNIKKAEHQIGLSDLVKYFREEKRILESTAIKILEINELRNTFHLNKSRTKNVCDIAQVEKALKLLVYVIQKAPKVLVKNKVGYLNTQRMPFCTESLPASLWVFLIRIHAESSYFLEDLRRLTEPSTANFQQKIMRVFQKIGRE